MFSNSLRVIARRGFRQVRNYSKDENFKPMTMNDLPVPNGSWKDEMAKKNSRYNKMLFFCSIFFVSAFLPFYFDDSIIINMPDPRKFDLK